jgi:hypothetical protein
MSLSHRQQHRLHLIEAGLHRSDPQLTAMLGAFGRLSASEAMPAWEQIPSRPQRIRQAAALTLKAIIIVTEALVLLLRAVLTLAAAIAGPRHSPGIQTPARERTHRSPGADGRPDQASES